jgi:hypothetical protein
MKQLLYLLQFGAKKGGFDPEFSLNGVDANLYENELTGGERFSSIFLSIQMTIGGSGGFELFSIFYDSFKL